MTWWKPWRREVSRNEEALRSAEQLRDRAEAQRRRVQAITPRVNATVTNLRRVSEANGFGSMIENVVRGGQR